MPLPVLVVDDSALACAAVSHWLGARGIEVTTAASSAEAAALDPAGFAAALLDLELGDGLGTELARRLRERAPGLPIAFLSASRDPALLAAARREGPVFSKVTGVDDAVRWVSARTAAGG